MRTVNNGWDVISVKYGFIRLLQRIFNCDKLQDISITPDKVLNSLAYGLPFRIIIYTSYKLSKMPLLILTPLIGTSFSCQMQSARKTGARIWCGIYDPGFWSVYLSECYRNKHTWLGKDCNFSKELIHVIKNKLKMDNTQMRIKN